MITTTIMTTITTMIILIHTHIHMEITLTRIHIHTHASKGKGRKGKQPQVAVVNTHYAPKRDESQAVGYASSFSKYSKQEDSFRSLPQDLRTKLDVALSEEALTLSLLPKLKHSSDPYFRNITRIQYVSGSFPKGFDEMQLQSYSEYINYEGDNAVSNNDVSSGPDMTVIQSVVVGGVLTVALALSVFFYVQKNKRRKKEVHIENIKSMKDLKFDSSSSISSRSSRKDNSKLNSSKGEISSSLEPKQHPWNFVNDDNNSNVVKPSWQEQIVSSSKSKGTGLTTSSRGTGLADLSSNINYTAEKVHGDIDDDDDEFTDAKADELSECSSYVNEFRGECYAPAGKLGVVLDTINNGSFSSVVVVYRIKPGSPLDGVLKIMDRIVAIDDIDTSNMSATEVNKVMVSKIRKTRKITFIRGGNFGVDPHDLEELRSIRVNASM